MAEGPLTESPRIIGQILIDVHDAQPEKIKGKAAEAIKRREKSGPCRHRQYFPLSNFPRHGSLLLRPAEVGLFANDVLQLLLKTRKGRWYYLCRWVCLCLGMWFRFSRWLPSPPPP